jgi:hypothetical protein
MKRLLALAPALLMALPALAQEAPEGAYKDLWCGIAFGTATEQAPNATPEQLTEARAATEPTQEQIDMIAQDDMIQHLTTGGQSLIEGASAAYLEAGFTAEQFATVQTELGPKVVEQVSGTGEAEFAFEDCFALLPPQE